MSAPEKVLVIGDDMRSFLATVRSLGRAGLEVHVAPYDFLAPALSSRYIKKFHALPVYLDGGDQWKTAITKLLESERFSLVIPCDERSLLPLVRHAPELSAYSVLSIPDEHGMAVFFDKHATRELAASLEISVADGMLLSATDTAAGIAARLGLPLIAKDRKSYAWPDIYVRTKAVVIKTADELESWLGSHQALGDTILFEKMFPGAGVGVSVLCDNGKILQAFEHHRVREFDGSGYYRKSAPINQSRLAAVSKLVAATGYTGIAMFEFKVDLSDDTWILLEVNARPWGSLPLPVAIGVDFPLRLYRLLVHGERSAPVGYPIARYGRNLVADFWQTRLAARSMLRTPMKLIGYLGNWLFGFRHLVTGHEYHDGVVNDDRQPGRLEIRQTIDEMTGTLRSKFLGWSQPRRSGLPKAIADLARSMVAPIRILIVCDGNICRSPYAELRLGKLLERYADRIEIGSAGMLPRNRRHSPRVAIDAAARRSIDLSPHMSQYAFAPEVEAASLILIFDMVNHRSMQARYPEQMHKVYFLGELANGSATIDEIPDPISKSAAGFDACYQTIDDCLARFAAQVEIANAGSASHA